MSKKRTIPAEQLERLYTAKSLTLKEVARQLHASTRTVRRNIDEQGIHFKTAGQLHKTHDMSGTRQYRIWQALKTRCSNPSHPQFEKYGDKGITYPAHWETFDGFWNDMANGYSDNKTIDRKDGSKGYGKSNCRWVSYKGQNRNKSDNVLLTYNGKTQCIAEWAEEVSIPQTTLYHRKNRGWSDEKILTTPVQKQFASNSPVAAS